MVAAWLFPMALGYAFTTTVHEVSDAARDTVDRAVAQVADVAPKLTVTGETTEQPPGPALVAGVQGRRVARRRLTGSRGVRRAPAGVGQPVLQPPRHVLGGRDPLNR